jgi:hypothetical protein
MGSAVLPSDGGKWVEAPHLLAAARHARTSCQDASGLRGPPEPQSIGRHPVIVTDVPGTDRCEMVGVTGTESAAPRS